jgi:hypothetical protein
MPQERWGPSWGLRVLAGLQGIIGSGLCCVMVWFFFPHALLVPVMAVAAVLTVSAICLPVRVLLDQGRGEVALTIGFWTRHVPLTQVTRVDETGTLGAWIGVGNGVSYGFAPFSKRRLLSAWLRPRLRTGFEGMEAAITRAAAIARGDAPDSPLPGENGSARGVRSACLLAGAGLLVMAVAALIQPQAGGWLVHAVALALAVVYWAGGGVAVLVGLVMLVQEWRDHHRPAPAG